MADSENQVCTFCNKPIPPGHKKCPVCGFDPTSWEAKEVVSAEEEDKKQTELNTLRIFSAVLVVLIIGVVVLRIFKLV